jgi:putative ABC transport system substrate-binding protein
MVSALAAKASTSTIPIVFVVGDDPVKAGLVASLGKPGGNVTGISVLGTALESKRLELLHELVPASKIGYLLNPGSPNEHLVKSEVQAAARALNQELIVVLARAETEFESIFARLATERFGALAVGADPLFTLHRKRIVALAAQHKIPSVYQWREFVDAGGLLSYGASLSDAYRQAGVYAGHILRGVKPADLPVVQPTKIELVINLKTAKALGLTIPFTLLARADELIE